MAEQTRIRVSFSAGEIELAGTDENVREWWKSFEEDVAQFRARFAQGGGAPPGANQDRGRASRPAVPENFGEYLHQFPTDITDIEKALVAGFFAQAQDENNSFTTGSVNELLIQQGVRLANPSSSIRRNVDARRAILLGGGQFRVSQTGTEYLARLQERQT
jgi:hypothetical protein